MAARTSEVQNRDEEFSRYLIENAGQDLVACLFQREDTLQGAAAVLSLSVADITEAERMLRALVDAAPADEGRRNPRITFCYTVNKAYPIYRLPQTTLFEQLTSFAEPTLDVYAAFYGGRLLLAPDADALAHYIRQLDTLRHLNAKYLLKDLRFVNKNGQQLRMMPLLKLDPALLQNPLYN